MNLSRRANDRGLLVSARCRLGLRAVAGRTIATLLFAALSSVAGAQAYTENFDNISLLTGNGWFIQNNSAPTGAISWFQGSPLSAGGPFNAYNGADNAYIAVNYASTSGGTGTISNWLVTPNRTLRNGDMFQFYTRKPTIGPGQTDYPDRLEVRMSTNGASVNVGTGGAGLGDFTSLLLSINPTLVANVYPQVWTQYTITVSGLPAPTSGRLAFRYFVTNAGPTGNNSDYIGIDNTVYTPYVCPAITISGTPGDGAFGQAYSASLSQTGALGAPSYAVTSGSLPTGLALSASGVISGTPVATGTFAFTVTASDASGCSGSWAYAITIGQGTQILTFPAQTVPSRWFDSGETFAIDPLASSASPNSGAPIVYSSLNAGVCTVSGTTVTMVAEGACQIAADQAGDGNFTAAAQVVSPVTLVTPTEADLYVQKTTSTPRVIIGGTAGYAIVVGNDGPAHAVNVRVHDPLPARLDAANAVWSCVEAIGTDCPNPDAGTGAPDITIPLLPRGTVIRFELFAQVIPAANPEDNFTPLDNTATVALPSGSGLTDPAGNNQSTATVQVEPTVIFTDGFEAQPQP